MKTLCICLVLFIVLLCPTASAQWVQTNGPYGCAIYSLAVSGTNLFAGIENSGVFRSTNNGTSWTPATTGLPNRAVYSLAVSGTNLFAGVSSSGVWRRPLWEMTTSVDPATNEVPHEFLLHQNYPNPFNPGTTIAYNIPGTGNGHEAIGNRWVRLVVYDLLGREVAVLVNEKKAPGTYEVQFDGSGLSSGVYFYRIQVRPLDSAGGRDSKSGAGDFISTKKMLVVK